MLVAATQEILQEVGTAHVWTPSVNDKKVKARFWTRYRDNPTYDTNSITVSEVQQVIGQDAGIARKWSLPEYREWFLNQGEHRERLEYLFDLALNAAEDILLNTDPKAQSARVNMVKAIADLAGKSARDQGQYKDQAIGKMDKEQLAAYLERHGVTVRKETVIEMKKDTDPLT
jgi:hypothetical protein